MWRRRERCVRCGGCRWYSWSAASAIPEWRNSSLPVWSSSSTQRTVFGSTRLLRSIDKCTDRLDTISTSVPVGEHVVGSFMVLYCDDRIPEFNGLSIITYNLYLCDSSRCHCFMMQYEKAADLAYLLFLENQWSKTTYAYLTVWNLFSLWEVYCGES